MQPFSICRQFSLIDFYDLLHFFYRPFVKVSLLFSSATNFGQGNFTESVPGDTLRCCRLVVLLQLPAIVCDNYPLWKRRCPAAATGRSIVSGIHEHCFTVSAAGPYVGKPSVALAGYGRYKCQLCACLIQ